MIHQLTNKARNRTASSHVLYLAVAIETLLLGYERLTETSLKLLYCEPIGNTWRLFYDGNIECLQAWQSIFIGYVALFAVPFIFVVNWASWKLQKNCISVREFLASCFLPTLFLIYWSVQYFKQADLKILKKSRKFAMTPSVCLNQKKRNEGQFTGKACWLAKDSLAALVLFKPLCLLTDPGPSCHNKTLPQFRHGHLWVDVPPNACYHFANQPDDDYFNVCQWAQVAILGFLPTIICILVVCAIVSQGIRLVIVLAGKLRSCHVDVVRKEKKLILKLLSLMIATSSRMAILTTPMTCLLRFLGRELS